MEKPALSVIGGVAGGVVAGVAASLLLNWAQSDADDVEREPPVRVITNTVVPSLDPDAVGVSAAVRVLFFDAGAIAPSSQSAPTSAEEFDAERREASERVRELLDQRVAEHNRAAHDAYWSPRAQADLTEGMQTLAEHVGATVDRVDCRTETCVAMVSWSTCELARRYSAAFVHKTYPVNCAMSVQLLDEGPVGSQGCQARVLLDCQGDANRGYGTQGG